MLFTRLRGEDEGSDGDKSANVVGRTTSAGCHEADARGRARAGAGAGARCDGICAAARMVRHGEVRSMVVLAVGSVVLGYGV